MLGGKSARLVARVVIALILGLVSFGMHATPVQAADVQLVLGGTGATTWNEQIKPGSSGTKSVTLQNTGTGSGSVTIWLSNIVSREGLNPPSETGNTAEPGELDQYLLLNLTASGLNTNITFPAKIGNFPQSVSDAKFIKISPLNAGETITLVWHWQLPPETGNDVQGDTLSFTINYTLEQLISPAPEPPTETGGGEDGGEASFVPNPVPSVPSPPITASDPANLYVLPGDIVQLSLEIVNLGRYDASDVIVNYGLPRELIVTSVASQGLTTIIDRQGGATLGTDNPERYDASRQVNANMRTIQSGKSKIITIDVEVTGEAALRTSISTLLQKTSLVISDMAQDCATDQYSLNINELTIKPVVNEYWPFIPLAKKLGEQADISVKVINICEAWRYNAIIRVNGVIYDTREIAHPDAAKQKDDYTITLKINGVTSQTKQVSLGKAESQYLTFALPSVNRDGLKLLGSLSSYWWIIPTGKYLVDVNGLRGQLTSELWINWLLITVILAVIALIILMIIRQKRKSRI